MFCKAYSVFIALITLNKLVEKKRFQTELWLLQLNWMMPFCTSPSPLHSEQPPFVFKVCADLSYTPSLSIICIVLCRIVVISRTSSFSIHRICNEVESTFFAHCKYQNTFLSHCVGKYSYAPNIVSPLCDYRAIVLKYSYALNRISALCDNHSTVLFSDYEAEMCDEFGHNRLMIDIKAGLN